MRIAFVVSTLARTGPTNQLKYIVDRLHQNECDLFVVTLSPEPQDSLKKEIESDVDCISLGLSRVGALIKGKIALRNVLNTVKADLVHTQGIRADRLVTGLGLSIPHVSTIRNFVFDDYPLKFGKFKGRLMAYSHFRALRKMNNVIGCSEELSLRYSKLGIRSETIRNGVNIDKFHPGPKEIERAKLRISPDECVFVYLGALIRRKAVGIVVRAFQKAVFFSKNDNVRLLIVGDGPERQSLEHATTSDNVRFEGASANPAKYLQAADWSVSASISEGFPNAVLESLACGTPVILSDIGPHAEIKRVAGDTCRLFPVGDEKRLSEIFSSLFRMPAAERANLGDKARKIAVLSLSAKRMADEYQGLYSRLIAGASK